MRPPRADRGFRIDAGWIGISSPLKSSAGALEPTPPQGRYVEDAARLLQLVVNGAAAGCIYRLIALRFVLIYKATEMVNFAQATS